MHTDSCSTLSFSLSSPITHSLTHSLTTHSLTHSLTHSSSHPLVYCLSLKLKKTASFPPHPSSSSSSSANDTRNSHLKGVDSKLAQTLLDELLEKDTNVSWSDIGN